MEYNRSKKTVEWWRMKKEFFNDAPIVIKKFLGYFQTIKGKSRKTVEEYFLDLRTFFKYMKRKRGKVSAEIEFEKMQEEAEKKLKLLQEIIIKAFWIWLYPNHKLNISEVEKLLNLPKGTLTPREEKNIASIVNLKKKLN